MRLFGAGAVLGQQTLLCAPVSLLLAQMAHLCTTKKSEFAVLQLQLFGSNSQESVPSTSPQ